MTENNEVLNDNKKIPKFTPYKIVVATLYALITLFLVGSLIDVIVNPGTNLGWSLALYLAIILIIIGGIANGICAVLSTVGIILSAVKRKDGCKTSTLIYFCVFAGLPIFTEFALILICTLIG